MNIKSSDLVLEIGPGAYPYWRSDCCADIFDETSQVDITQFGGKKLDTKGKPLFRIENGKLPFKDSSFDYVICSHVFEHVPITDLPLLASEIRRVGKKVYIEFPKPMYDFIYNFDVHVNLLDIVNGEIICIDKKHTGLHTVQNFSKLSLALRQRNLFSIDAYFPSVIAVGYEFSGSVPLRIIEDEQEFFDIVLSNTYYCQRPTIVWQVLNKIHPKRMWKAIAGEKKREFFNSKLLR